MDKLLEQVAAINQDWTIIVFSLSTKILIPGLCFVGLLVAMRFFNWGTGGRMDSDTSALIKSNAMAAALFHGLKILAVALLVGLASGCSAQAGSFSNTYDKEIRTATARWMPTVDWMLWKAQLYQESRLDPSARSPAGAEGLAQFMPGTWKEVSAAMGYSLVSRRIAEPSINAGAFYMAKLRKNWSAPRPESDRHDLAMASYNAGLGNILSAQRECGEVVLYKDIIACLPEITGAHAAETIGYAPAIRRWYRLMRI